MTKKIERNYLEISSLQDLKTSDDVELNNNIFLLEPCDFQVNKFFYKNVGKKYNWVDRLNWTDNQWIDYSTNKKVKTYILRIDNDLAGFYELIVHNEKKEVEIAYLGLLENYLNKKLGSYLLTSAIKNSFKNEGIKRTWVHTCSLDHKNALNNYIARGMKIFKKEMITI